jgi:hypothetical protein
MSVFEPHTDQRSDGGSHLPTLDVALRGRKGEQVAAYIQELATRLDQQRARAEQAEQAASHLQREVDAQRNQPPPSFDHLGSEAAKVLEEAGRSAKVLIEEATSRGKTIVEQAKERAADVMEAAEHDVQTRLDAAHQAAEQMLAKAGNERSAVDAQTRRLRDYRDGLIGHLGRVHADLARFLAEVSDPPSAQSAGAETKPAQAKPAQPRPEQPKVAQTKVERTEVQAAAESSGHTPAAEAETDAAATVEMKPAAASAISAARPPK